MSRTKKRRARASQELITARRQVEQWRRYRPGKRSRVPQDVWDVAVAAARVEGIWATSQALRLKYDALKAQVEGAPANTDPGCAEMGKSPFVEIAVAAAPTPLSAVPLPSPGAGVGTTVVEMMGPHGERMRVAVTGASAVDIVGLSQTFWRAGS